MRRGGWKNREGDMLNISSPRGLRLISIQTRLDRPRSRKTLQQKSAKVHHSTSRDNHPISGGRIWQVHVLSWKTAFTCGPSSSTFPGATLLCVCGIVLGKRRSTATAKQHGILQLSTSGASEVFKQEDEVVLV
jgi:hypothetical protein